MHQESILFRRVALPPDRFPFDLPRFASLVFYDALPAVFTPICYSLPSRFKRWRMDSTSSQTALVTGSSESA
jgi:hypothetical protein